MKMKALLIGVLCFSFISITACTSNDQSNVTVNTNNEGDEQEANNIANNSNDGNNEYENNRDRSAEGELENITLRVVVPWDEEMFVERFKEPIEEAYPHITLEQIQQGWGREELEEIFATDINPDIFFGTGADDLIYLGIDYDHSELVEHLNYDTSHIIPELLETIRANDPQGRLLGLPYETEPDGLIFNKNVFDLFGESYPEEDMTWDDVVTLAQQVTGEENGVQYRGLDFLYTNNIPIRQFSINATDPETGAVLILEKDEFSRELALYERIIQIPGNYDDDFLQAEAKFSEGETAMLISRGQGLDWLNNDAIDIDVTTIPVWPDHPNTAPRVSYLPLSVNPHSDHIEDAFRVIAYFTGAEYQTMAVRQGVPPVTNVREVQEQFLQDRIDADNYNILSLFKHSPASPPERISRYDQYVNIDWAVFAESDLDVGEYLRQVAEEAEATIQDVLAQE